MVSVEAYERSLAKRVALNRQILENPYWRWDYDDKGHENYVPVGRGERTSPLCGSHVGFDVCKDVDAHKGVVVNGVDYTGKGVVRHKHLWCHKSDCCVCFIRGWAVRGARAVESRLVEASERGFGDVEHVVVSLPLEDRNLSESVLRVKARSALSVRGVDAGGMIFHGYAMDRERHLLVWRPHYHTLGFLEGGYKCRGCNVVPNVAGCSGCDGFEGCTRKAYESDKTIVKVLDKRQTVFGSAWYQLHHSTIRLGIKRFHVVTYFGKMAYNNFERKKPVLPVEVACPVCKGGMVKHAYVGKKRIARNLSDADYVPFFAVDAVELSDFVECVGRGSVGHVGRGKRG